LSRRSSTRSPWRRPLRLQPLPDAVPPEHQAFADTVAASRLQDWRPTFERLSANTGVPVDDLVHHALVRWVSAGAEALMAVDPLVLGDLRAAVEREDWDAVRGIVSWLGAGG
jgi:hypothetical protein